MPPYQGGGDMILSVSFEKTVFNALPYKFEAGTPNVEAAIGLGAAIDYLEGLDVEGRIAHERELLAYGTSALSRFPGIRLIGTAAEKSSVLSFVMDDVHPHDVGTILDREGIAVRTGHHCAQPVLRQFGVDATVRASLAFYNTQQELDALIRGLQKVQEIFQ
jgi:cysteine desulfurase/selenocysteine lyase